MPVWPRRREGYGVHQEELRVMTFSMVLLGVSVCVALGAIVRWRRDVAVLRSLERLLEGCDQEQRVEVGRILAASLHEVGRSKVQDAQLPGESPTR